MMLTTAETRLGDFKQPPRSDEIYYRLAPGLGRL
jgi:hypothetical protein